MVKIEIKTSNKSLFTDLQSENIPDLKLSFRAHTYDSVDLVSPAITVLTIILESSKIITLSILSTWLFNRFKNKNTEKATIDNIDIVKNPEKIIIIINNYIQIIKDQTKNNKKD